MFQLTRKQVLSVVLPCVVLTSYVLLSSQMISYQIFHRVDDDKDNMFITVQNETSPFLVDTPACRIPDLDPMDISVRHWAVRPMGVACPRDLSLTYVVGETIVVNRTAAAVSLQKEEGKLEYCRYQTIHHPENGKHNEYTYSVPSERFTASVKVNREFIRVQCYNSSNSVIYTNFHYVTIPLHFDLHVPGQTSAPSVLMLGLDSVSRMNYLRYMQETQRLMTRLGALEFVGYNKVADNTFVNLVPLLAGKFAEDLPWNENIRHQNFDSFRFIWNDYRDKGYVTMFVEDAPYTAMFDNAKAGFTSKPTDFYNRPMAVAMEETERIWFENHLCVMDQLETDILLDYVLRIVKMAATTGPYFALVYLSRITHDYIEGAGTIDDSIHKFLDDLHSEGHLTNTVVLLFSDHGMRYGEIRNTYIGKLEERLPLLNILLPKTFSETHGKYMNNLEINTKRLTTPFDVHEFLRHLLLQDDYTPSSEKGVSLMNAIPTNRSCESAYISPHWCTCTEMISVPVNSSIVLKISNFFVNMLNVEIKNDSHRCAPFVLDEVQSAYLIKPRDKVLKFLSVDHEVLNKQVLYGDAVNPLVHYQLTIRTHPGEAVFEGTFLYNEEYRALSLVSDISRLSRYQEFSQCVSSPKLKKYCYCVDKEISS